jgi:hypothetical protein
VARSRGVLRRAWRRGRGQSGGRRRRLGLQQLEQRRLQFQRLRERRLRYQRLRTGVYGTSASGYGVYSAGNAGVSGNLDITGTLSKGGGSFKIDHPLDPANKFLYHSFVESPDMKNVYDGVVTLDAKGEATVTLPAWFETLNRDTRIQLTAVGEFSPLYVKTKLQNGAFSIAGGKAGQEVYWQLTGIRKDAWADAHRIPVEEDKPAAERGLYLHPTEHGQPVAKGIDAVRNAAIKPHKSK